MSLLTGLVIDLYNTASQGHSISPSKILKWCDWKKKGWFCSSFKHLGTLQRCFFYLNPCKESIWVMNKFSRCNNSKQSYTTPQKNPGVQIEQAGLFCLRRMTVHVSHQVCDSLVKRDRNSLSQSTQSRGLQMQKIKIHLQEKAKQKPPTFT